MVVKKLANMLIMTFVALLLLSSVVYAEIIDGDSAKSNYKEYDSRNLSVKGNDYSILTININLLNAPFNNEEYCKNKLTQKSFYIRLISKPEGSVCNNYPDKVIINDNGTLNINTHTYTKTGTLDLSDTYFSTLGEYVFGLYQENSNEELFQIIVVLENVTSASGVLLDRTSSLILIKSLLQNGEKVTDININVNNPNTSIRIKKPKNVNAFNEDVYVDVYIDSYDNDIYTLMNGNITNNSFFRMGNHYVLKNNNGYIIPQAYKIENDNIIIIGKNNDTFEIPVGTKYKVALSNDKNYKEKYSLDGGEDYRVAIEDEEENEVKIISITNSNPKTGLFYNIIPFIIVIFVAIIGIIIIKKISVKTDKEYEEDDTECDENN